MATLTDTLSLIVDSIGLFVCSNFVSTWQCYAIINGASGILQVLVIPIVAKRVDLRKYWTVMPTIILAGTIWMIVDQSCSLMVVAPTFMAMKTIEFSIRGVSNEMVSNTEAFVRCVCWREEEEEDRQQQWRVLVRVRICIGVCVCV